MEGSANATSPPQPQLTQPALLPRRQQRRQRLRQKQASPASKSTARTCSCSTMVAVGAVYQRWCGWTSFSRLAISTRTGSSAKQTVQIRWSSEQVGTASVRVWTTRSTRLFRRTPALAASSGILIVLSTRTWQATRSKIARTWQTRSTMRLKCTPMESSKSASERRRRQR